MSEIKVGSRVQVKSLMDFDKAYGIYIGVAGTVRRVELFNGQESAYMTWDDHDVDDERVMYKDQLELIEDDEPDLYLYPDTPKGTKIIAIQDTVSAYEVKIPKGTVLKLERMAYIEGGTHIIVNGRPLKNYDLMVNVEHFMILEDQA